MKKKNKDDSKIIDEILLAIERLELKYKVRIGFNIDYIKNAKT